MALFGDTFQRKKQIKTKKKRKEKKTIFKNFKYILIGYEN